MTYALNLSYEFGEGASTGWPDASGGPQSHAEGFTVSAEAAIGAHYAHNRKEFVTVLDPLTTDDTSYNSNESTLYRAIVTNPLGSGQCLYTKTLLDTLWLTDVGTWKARLQNALISSGSAKTWSAETDQRAGQSTESGGVYFGARMHIPYGWTVPSGFVNLLQIHTLSNDGGTIRRFGPAMSILSANDFSSGDMRATWNQGPIPYEQTCTEQFVFGEWNTIQMWFQAGTPANSDAQGKVWINGVLANSRTGMNGLPAGTYGTIELYWNLYAARQGGTLDSIGGTDNQIEVYWDDVRVSDLPITWDAPPAQNHAPGRWYRSIHP